MPDPLKASVMQDFRDAVGVNASPSFFNKDSPISPTILVGGNIGFPKPRANQKFRYTTVRTNGSSTDYQIATVTATKRIYFIGIQYNNNLGVAASCTFFDATSGSAPSLSTGTAYQDDAGYLMNFVAQATSNDKINANLPYPIEVKKGIRMTGGGAGQDLNVNIYYIEEDTLV